MSETAAAAAAAGGAESILERPSICSATNLPFQQINPTNRISPSHMSHPHHPIPPPRSGHLQSRHPATHPPTHRTAPTHPLLVEHHALAFVVDEVVQGQQAADEGGQVQHQHHVVALHSKGARQVRHVQVGQQVEDVLQAGRGWEWGWGGVG